MLIDTSTKSRAYRRHSAFAPFFASTWLHSLCYAEVSYGKNAFLIFTMAKDGFNTMNRRDFVKGGVVGLAATGVSVVARGGGATGDGRDSEYPFKLGVASGDVTSSSVVLWTRLAPDPMAGGGGMSADSVPVKWRLSLNPEMTSVVQQGEHIAGADFAHSVHVDLKALEPDREYWYQFYSGEHKSELGRTKTLPAADSSPSSVRFATVSCQNYTHGYFVAYGHIVADQPDFIIHLGDYIYDKSFGKTVRKHDSETLPETLTEFRRRHALYKSDPHLRAAHAQIPFFTTIDNHDAIYDNNPAHYAKRAAAYQAWYEHMPVRGFSKASKNTFQLHRKIEVGDLLGIALLDTRQYRDTENLCPENGDPEYGFGHYQPLCQGHLDRQRSMLGAAQEQWLSTEIRHSRSVWQSIASTGPFSPYRFYRGGKTLNYIGAWDGYPANRQRIVDAIAANTPGRTLIVSGDVHSFWAFDGSQMQDESERLPVVEFVTSSITADWPEPLAKTMRENLVRNPQAKLYNPDYRGYMLHQVNRSQWQTTARAVEDVRDLDSDAFDLAHFVVSHGKPGFKTVP